MKILQVAPCYVDIFNETGGVANVVRQICLHLEENKIETILICSNTELGKIVANPRIINFSEYLTVYIINQYKNPLLGPTNDLKSLLKSFSDISIVHIHTCFSVITDYSLKYFVKQKIPVVFTPHGKLSPTMFSKNRILKTIYFNIILKQNIAQINSFITNSVNEIYYAKNLGISCHFSYIYNGYENLYLNSSDKNYFNLKEKSFLLFLGYLDPRKQPDLLIKAFAKSKAKRQYKLVLAGPDSYGYKNNLEALSKSLGLKLNDEIIFTGRVQGESKFYLLKNAKALILPSKGEGWPVVIAEAIGAKIPIIISKECNFSEINVLKLGIEVSDFDINSWTAAIDEICFNIELYKSFQDALEKYSRFFSWDYITTQWQTKYLEIINGTTIK